TAPRLTGTGLRRRCSRVRTCWRCTRSSPAPTWTLPDALDKKWLTRLADQRQRIGMTTLRRGLALSLVVLVMGAAAPVTAKAKPTAAQKCTAAKLKASAKKLSAKLACWAKAAAKNAPVDDACTGKAETNFKAAFSTAESKGGCVGDATGVEANIEAFVQSEVTALHSDGTKDGGKCASAKLKAAGKMAMAELLCNAKAVAKNVPVDPTCLGKAGTNLGKAFSK